MRTAPRLALALALPTLVAMFAGCPTDPKEPATDGGSHDDQDERQPACVEQGIPCSQADVSSEARARTAEVLAAIDERLEAGEALADVAAFVRAHEHVVDMGETTGAFWFRVEGGRPHSVLDGSKRRPGPVAVPGMSGFGVVRPPDAAATSHNGEQKRALFVEPFRWQMGSNQPALIASLQDHRDYERAGAVEHRVDTGTGTSAVGPDAFLGWRDRDLVMVTTHGLTATSETSGARQVVLYSSVRCTDDGSLPEGMSLPGVDCGRLRLQVEDGQGGASWRSYSFLTMDQSFFDRAYPDGLRSQIVILDACESNFLQLGGGQSVVLGWTDTIRIDSSIATMDALFEHLVDEGLAVIDALQKLEAAGLASYDEPVDVDGEERPTRPELLPQGNLFLLAREVVHLVDPATGGVIGESSLVTLEAGQPDQHGTPFSIDVLIEGVLPADMLPAGSGYTLSIHDDEAGEGAAPLAGPLAIPLEGMVDGRILREQVDLLLPRAARNGEEIRLRAELKLPHRGVSTHTTTVFLLVEEEPAWSLSFPEVLSGDSIYAPLAQVPVGLETPWQLVLQPTLDDVAGLPNGMLLIENHRGRESDCTGATGSFALGLAAESDTHRYMAEEAATIEITRFDEVAFEATLFGTVTKLDKSRPDDDGETVQVVGTVRWPGSGCTAHPEEPGPEEFYGSSRVPEAPFQCTDNWVGSIYVSAEHFFEVCDASGLSCSEDPCPDAQRIAQCDFRNPGAPIPFAGLVHSYYEGIDQTLTQIEQGCTMNGGVFLVE